LNHTIYGFHFAGHYGFVDNLGFFIVDEMKAREYDDVTQGKMARIKGVE
jgi:hypothetical protein